MAIFQTVAPYTCATQAQYQTWAQTVGQALSSFGWVKQSGHGEVTDNGLTGSSYAWTNSPTCSSTAATNINAYPQAYNFRGAFVPSTTYLGANTINSAAQVDVVTSGGLTYVHITASSSLATAPASDTTNWAPLNFEIWKSNGAMSSTFPIYLKFIFTTSTGNASPAMLVSAGTGVDASGNLTGSFLWGLQNPTHTLNMYSASLASPSSGNFDMDFSGDADNFRMCMFKTTGAFYLYAFDRAKTASGTDSDAFAYFVAMGFMNNSNPQAIRSGIFLKPVLGNAQGISATSWSGVVTSGSTLNTAFGGIPPFPIFPLLGYLGNPLTGLMAFGRSDTSEGQTVPVWLYGASHNYLVIGNAASACSPDGISGRLWPAIRWE